jgi:putative transposase
MPVRAGHLCRGGGIADLGRTPAIVFSLFSLFPLFSLFLVPSPATAGGDIGGVPAGSASGTFFFTVVVADRTSGVLVDHVDALREAFRITREERPFTIDAIVVLPEHLHAIMTLPAGDTDCSGRWRRIKGLFARQVVAAGVAVKRDARGEYALWQSRFWEHTIRDDGDLTRHFDYIHFNPVKHGHVARVSDWPHSSFHRYVRAALLPSDWAGDAHEMNVREPAPSGLPAGRATHAGEQAHRRAEPYMLLRLFSISFRIIGVRISCMARSSLPPGMTMELARDMKLPWIMVTR